jgi:hypothetical protein
LKKTAVGTTIKTLDEEEAKKATQRRFAQNKDQATLRQQEQSQKKTLEKTATKQSQSPSRKKVMGTQNIEKQKKKLATQGKQAVETLKIKQRLDNIVPTDKKSAQDVERQRIKLQRKCKHVFNRSTGRCESCDKHRSAHI